MTVSNYDYTATIKFNNVELAHITAPSMSFLGKKLHLSESAIKRLVESPEKSTRKNILSIKKIERTDSQEEKTPENFIPYVTSFVGHINRRKKKTFSKTEPTFSKTEQISEPKTEPTSESVNTAVSNE